MWAVETVVELETADDAVQSAVSQQQYIIYMQISVFERPRFDWTCVDVDRFHFDRTQNDVGKNSRSAGIVSAQDCVSSVRQLSEIAAGYVRTMINCLFFLRFLANGKSTLRKNIVVFKLIIGSLERG